MKSSSMDHCGLLKIRFDERAYRFYSALIAALGTEGAPLNDSATLQTRVTAFHHAPRGHAGEKTHRAVSEHHAHHEAPPRHRTVADHTCFVQIAADLITERAGIVAPNLVTLQQHRQRDVLR